MSKRSAAVPERRLVARAVERRAVDGRPTEIVGYAAMFDVETVIGCWFREVIRPGAFTASIAKDDVVAQFNHDPNYVLGRTANKTCRLAEDAAGLRYEIDLNEKDPDAIRVSAKVERGDVNGSSFAFTCENEGDDEWVRDDPAKLPLRIIHRAQLWDVAPVTSPAYPSTSAAARSKALALTTAAAAAARATATGTADGGEEQAELVGYRGLQVLVEQLAGLQAEAAGIIEGLIADETEDPTESAGDEAGEEAIETARLAVLSTLTGQMRALLDGIDSLSATVAAGGTEDPSGDLMAMELGLDEMESY